MGPLLVTSELKSVRLATANQQQTEIFQPWVLSGNDLLSQRLSQRQVRGQKSCLLVWDCHFCLTAGQKEFLGAISVPTPQITGQRTHSDGTGKVGPVGTFRYTVIHTVGWEGNGARSLITVSWRSLQLLSREGIGLIVARCWSNFQTPYPASSCVNWSQSSLFIGPLFLSRQTPPTTCYWQNCFTVKVSFCWD